LISNQQESLSYYIHKRFYKRLSHLRGREVRFKLLQIEQIIINVWIVRRVEKILCLSTKLDDFSGEI